MEPTACSDFAVLWWIVAAAARLHASSQWIWLKAVPNVPFNTVLITSNSATHLNMCLSWSCHFKFSCVYVHMCWFVSFALFPVFCFLVLLTRLFFPPHLSAVCLISPALLPEFFPSLLPLHTCTISPFLPYLPPVFFPFFFLAYEPLPCFQCFPFISLTCVSRPHSTCTSPPWWFKLYLSLCCSLSLCWTVWSVLVLISLLLSSPLVLHSGVFSPRSHNLFCVLILLFSGFSEFPSFLLPASLLISFCVIWTGLRFH